MKSTKEIWKLSDSEFCEIEELFERKIALENLAKVIDPNNQSMYEKLIKDYGKAVKEFQLWWDKMSIINNWEGAHWWVDFQKKCVMSNV